MALIDEPIGPMQNGTTYIVRPCMQPAKRPLNVARISAGSAQLLVGPASISCSEQMKVRLSTRATSRGSEAAEKEFGRLTGSRRVSVPAATSASVSVRHSSSEPSHHWMRAGWVSAAVSRTQSNSRR